MAARSTDYLIIGNSAAGVSAAEAIRSYSADASVLILSREPYAAYGRPLISYMIEGKTTEEKMGYKDPDFYTRNNFDTLFGTEYEAVSLDPQAHTVTLSNGDVVNYGKVLLATGSNSFVPPFKGYDGQKNAHAFMTLDDAKSAWADVNAATQRAHEQGKQSRVVVIGGGLIGLKAAEALSHHADIVEVFELAPRILPAVLDNQGAQVLQTQLLPHGIVCHPGVSVSEFESEGDQIVGAQLTDGGHIDIDVLMLCVGVRPNSSLAVDAGAEQGRGLVVGTDLQTTLPDVYAAGDLVQITDALDGSKRPLALWPIAVQHGKIAGMHMVGDPQAEPFVDAFAVNAVDFFEVSLLTAGLINPAPEAGCQVRIQADQTSYVKTVTRDGLLVGYILLNRPDRAGIYTSIIQNKIPLDAFEGDIFAAAPENISFPEPGRWNRLHMGYPSSLDQRGWKVRE